MAAKLRRSRINVAAVRFVMDRMEGSSHLPDELPAMQHGLQQFLAGRRREATRPPEPTVSKEALAAACARMRNLGGWR